jgi:hypothetical protein
LIAASTTVPAAAVCATVKQEAAKREALFDQLATKELSDEQFNAQEESVAESGQGAK